MTIAVALAALAAGDDDRRTYDETFLDAIIQRERGNSDSAVILLNRCLELDSTASEAYFFLAQYFDKEDEGEKAFQYYQKAALLDPANPTFNEILAQAYIERKQFPEAIATLEHLYSTSHDRDDLLNLLLQLYMHVKDFKKATETVERMELIDGKSDQLSYTKIGLYMQTGDTLKAVDEMRDLAAQYPYDLSYRANYADMLMLGDSVTKGLATYNEILEEEPYNYHALSSLWKYYSHMGDVLAADSLSHRILLNPKTTTDDRIEQLRYVIGDNEATGGDNTRIMELFREILAMPQPEPEIAMLAAAYMEMKGMPKDGIQDMLGTVLRLQPENASARLRLVSMAWDADDNARIIELCKEARQYNPDEMAFYYYQGMAYYRSDDYDNALEALQNGISVINEDSSPEIVSDFYAIMGDLLHQKGKDKQAFAAYDSCLVWKSDNISCLNNYAYYLSELGQQLDKAENMSHQTIIAEPKNTTYLDTYAWILFKQQRYAEARIYIDQALRLDSTLSNVVLEHAGDIYYMSGSTDEAVHLWQKALAEDPQDKILIRKIKQRKYIKK